MALYFFFANILNTEAALQTVLYRYLRSLIYFGLGMVNLFSFEIYFIRKKSNTEKVIRVLLVAYTIAFFSSIFKRNYIRHNRVQFVFTEPSFIGMHVFGVLLPFYIFSGSRKQKNLIIAFSVFTLFTMTSVRFVADSVAVGTLFVIFHANWKKIKNIILGIIFLLIYDNNRILWIQL